MTLRALITRPEEDAAPLAAALNQRGIETTIESLLSIRTLTDAELDLSGVQAILFTSANGVRAFTELAAAKGAAGWREIPALAVGDATARTARAAGFAQVGSAGGNVESLAELVSAKLDPQKGPLFHAAGSAVAGDLAGLLGGRGFELRRAMIYEARPAESLSSGTLDALRAGAFAALTQAAGDKAVDGCRRAAALCLSPAVASAISALPFRTLETADHPDLPSMLQLVEKVAGTTAPAEPEKIIDVTPSATVPKPPPALAPSRTHWLMTALAAAIVGAIVAAAVSLLLRQEPQELSADINAALEERLTAAEKSVTDLGARLTAAEESSAAAKSDVAKVASDLARLRADMTSMAAGTGDAGDTASQLAELTNRLGAAEEKLKSLAAPAADGVEGDTAVRLSAENIQMKKDLAALRDDLGKTVAENDRLTARLADVEGRLQDNSAAAAQAAFTLAVANLNKTLATAQPFAAPLAALKVIAGKDPALSEKVAAATDPIAPFGARGVPTLAGLSSSFPATADAIARAVTKAEASQTAATDQGFFGKTWDRIAEGMSDAVTVRPEGEAEGNGPLERLARAELRLSESKLADAVAELEGLSGPAREAAAPWLDQAKARLAVDGAMETLSQMALVSLPGSVGNAGG
jgi:uroporphyrinogen-III synthase/predicted  nucleic acid-binding Zn-ribbon protein